MFAAQHRSGSSPWRFTRYWTTLACLTSLIAGLMTLSAGHPLHGWLMVLASLVLVKGTVWGRRSRRHTDLPMMAADAAKATSTSGNSRKWRKAA